MALINQNSIIGVTSITSPSASNVLTVHTNDTTERLRVSTSGVSFSGTNASLDTSGNATFNGNVSIGGTLTYEDVTNIDSVGVVTARSGLHVTGGNLGVGLNTPAAQLHLSGPAEIRLNNAADAGNFARIRCFEESGDNGAHLAFNTGAGEVVRFRNDGNVGIGSESPSQKLDVAGTVQFKNNGATLKIESVPGNNFTQVQFKNDGGSFYVGRENNSGNWFATGSNYASVLRSDGAYPLIFRVNGQNSLNIDTNGNIGINDTAPSQKLNVGGNIMLEGSDQFMYLTNVGTGNAGMYIRGRDATSELRSHSTGMFTWEVTGSEKMRLNSGGNLGIGNIDPTQARLVAQTASGMSIAAVKDNTGASISLGGVTQPRILMEAGASASQFKLYTASGSSYSSAGWRQRLHVTDTSASVSSTGNGANGIGCFGIADNSPDSRALALSIGGGSGLYGIEDSRPMVYLQRSYGIGGGSSTDETTLEVSAPGSYNSAGIIYGIKSRAQHNLNGSHYAGHFEAHGSQYSANGTSALYAKTTKLDTNGPGDVIAFRADGSVLQVGSGSGSAIAGYFASGNNVNSKPIVCQNGYTTNSYSNQIIFRKHNGSGIVDVGSIKSNNTATQYNTSSDYRLKENIVSLTGAIDRLKQLQPKRFNFIGIDETIDGFIAHEVNPIAPYAVSGEKDAVKKELVLDEDGKEQFDENGEIIDREVIDPQGVDYSKLITLTIAALQEALAKIETLEAAVAALQGS